MLCCNAVTREPVRDRFGGQNLFAIVLVENAPRVKWSSNKTTCKREK